MVPLIVLFVSFAIFVLAGLAGLTLFRDLGFALRAALAVMFIFTASAHWGRLRGDLIRMVPPAFPRPDLWVTATGLLEIAGAVALLLPRTAGAASICLALLLLAMFPANVRAAREGLTIGGRPVQNVPVRGAIQLVFVGMLIAAAWLA